MSHNSYEVAEKKLFDKAETDLLELRGRNYFNKYDIEFLKDQIEELKKRKWYHIAFGLSLGILLTIVIIHYT